jgi:hypothetical protein
MAALWLAYYTRNQNGNENESITQIRKHKCEPCKKRFRFIAAHHDPARPNLGIDYRSSFIVPQKERDMAAWQ